MLYILRHGQSQANADQIIAGHQDSPLSDLGRRQAQRIGEALRRNLSIDLIVSSPMARARQTAEIVAGGISYDRQKIIYIPELEERRLGELEGKRYSETPYGNGNVEDAEGAIGIEPIEAFYARVKRALAAIVAHSPRNGVVVCHNGTGRMLHVIAADGQPIDMYKQPRLEHGVAYPLASGVTGCDGFWCTGGDS